MCYDKPKLVPQLFFHPFSLKNKNWISILYHAVAVNLSGCNNSLLDPATLSDPN